MHLIFIIIFDVLFNSSFRKIQPKMLKRYCSSLRSRQLFRCSFMKWLYFLIIKIQENSIV